MKLLTSSSCCSSSSGIISNSSSKAVYYLVIVVVVAVSPIKVVVDHFFCHLSNKMTRKCYNRLEHAAINLYKTTIEKDAAIMSWERI
jgi:hypothetical protein